MKGKLIRTVDGYELFTQGFLKGSTNHGLIKSLNIEEGPIRYKLSIKNCQAIEQDSPLQEYVLEVNGEGWDDHLYRGSRKQTEWEVSVVMKNNRTGKIINSDFDLEWDEDGLCDRPIPKLDADGCLILKRI